MTRHQINQYMKRNGFDAIKTTLHTTVWFDGTSRVAVATRPSGDRRAWWNIQKDVRRAVDKRMTMEKISMTGFEPVTREPERKIIQNPLKASIGDMMTQKTETTVTETTEQPATYSKFKRGKRTGFTSYPEGVKEEISLKLMEWKEQRFTQREMVNRLNAMGYRNSEGNPFTAFVVFRFLKDLGLTAMHKQKARLVKPYKKAEKVYPSNMAELKEQHATRMKATPVERQISDYIIQILQDPILSDAKKVRMLLAYIEV